MTKAARMNIAAKAPAPGIMLVTANIGTIRNFTAQSA